MNTVFPTGFNNTLGVWVAFYEGMRTGVRDNDFNASLLRVFLTQEAATNFVASDTRNVGVKVSFLPFGRMLRHGWEMNDHKNVRYVAPGFPVTETTGTEAWIVHTIGRQFGRDIELTNVFFFPSKKEAQRYMAIDKREKWTLRRVYYGVELTR